MLPLSLSRARAALALGTASLFLFATPSLADVEEILIGAILDEGEGWTFEISIEGSGLVSASVDFPAPPVRTENPTGDSSELVYEDDQGPFATFAELQARNPAGDYVVTVEDGDGTKVVTLNWNPTPPANAGGGDASLSLVFPQTGSTLGCRGPDVVYETDCVNCVDLDSEIFGISGTSAVVQFEQQVGPFENPIPFEESQNESGGSASPLPDGLYEIELAFGDFAAQSGLEFDSGPTDSFDYVEEASLADTRQFTVAGTGGPNLVDFLIGAIREKVDGPDPEWTWQIEGFGFDLCSLRIDGPGGQGFYVPLDGSGELEYDTGPFATFDDLQASHPVGTYSLTVNQEWTDDVVWNPTEPVGAGGEPFSVVTSPADGSTISDRTPDIAYTSDCTNCAVFDVDLEPLGPGFGYNRSGGTPFPPSPIAFDSLRDPFDDPPTPLADGDYEIELLFGFLETVGTSLTGPGQVLDPYDYEEEASVIGLSEFTVPEPGAFGATAAVCAALAALVRRRRQG